MNSFEDLIAWQKTRQLTRAIYEVTKQGDFAKDFGLSGQLQRAAVSIMSNIAEGFERNRRSEFHQFLIHRQSFVCGSPVTIVRRQRHSLSRRAAI